MTVPTNHSTLVSSAPAPLPGAPDGSSAGAARNHDAQANAAAGVSPRRAARGSAEIPVVLRLPDLNAPLDLSTESKPAEDSQITTYLLTAVLVGVLAFLAVDHWKASHEHYSQMRAAKNLARPVDRTAGAPSASGQALTDSSPGGKRNALSQPAEAQPPSPSPAAPDPTAKRMEDRRADASTENRVFAEKPDDDRKRRKRRTDRASRQQIASDGGFASRSACGEIRRRNRKTDPRADV